MSITKRPEKKGARRPNRNKSRKPSAGPKDAARHILYGWHACSAALRNPERVLKHLWCSDNAAQRLQLEHVPRPDHLVPEIISATDLSRKLPDGAVHQGIALETEPLDFPSVESVADGRTILLLDQITDPHNVGAILRSAAAFNAAAVIAPSRHAPPESATMAKSASGAMECVPYIRIPNLAQAMEILKGKGYWCIGMDGSSQEQLGHTSLPTPCAFVMGAEGSGMRHRTHELCDMVVALPMTGTVESLNVSNAAAIALFSLYQSQQSALPTPEKSD